MFVADSIPARGTKRIKPSEIDSEGFLNCEGQGGAQCFFIMSLCVKNQDLSSFQNRN
jgi:hypothetical protein